MKKIICALIIMTFLYGCESSSLPQNIPESRFDDDYFVEDFDEGEYLKAVESILMDVDYQKKDFANINQEITQDPLMNRHVIESMISLFNTFQSQNDVFEVINFFDHHMFYMTSLDREVLLYKLISLIEEGAPDKQSLIDDERFKVLGADYLSRVTDVFLNNFEITDVMVDNYPDIYEYVDKLKKAVSGGYQIRRIDNAYYLLPDYASALTRYKDYLSDESSRIIDILGRESRNPVFIEGYYQRENETAAYKATEIELFLKAYPNSRYYKMMRAYYIQYLKAIVSNPRNIESTGSEQEYYKESVVSDFNRIIERYGNSHLARILTELLEWVELESYKYDPLIIEKIYEMIEQVY